MREYLPQCTGALRPARAFTLIELLIVISIISLLAGMLMPVVGLARRNGNITNTKVLLRKVDAALHVFRNEVGAYPFAKPSGTVVSNRLGMVLAYDQDLAESRGTWVQAEAAADGSEAALRNAVRREQARALADAQVAEDQYLPASGARRYYSSGLSGSTPTLTLSDLNFDHYQPGGIRPANVSVMQNLRMANQLTRHVGNLTRQAMERGRIGILSGNLAVAACVWDSSQGEHDVVPGLFPAAKGSCWSPTGPALVASPTSLGWTADYLAGELTPRNRDPDDHGVLIDAFGQPINYLCTIVAGARPNASNVGGLSANAFASIGAADEGGSGMLRGLQPGWYALEPRAGRLATTLLASDRRSSAAEAWLWTFELWSAGPDAASDVLRSASSCRDDLSLVRYAEGLQ
jgi:prepilin-type N-terminal cleavage/methylation domain-containing protein